MEQFAHAQNDFQSRSSDDLATELLSDDRRAIPLSELAPILIASPHPDDETLGCGGLIARCASEMYPVSVLAMTNGDASHPGDGAWRRKLGQIRKREQSDALKALGFPKPDIIPLELPDGELEQLAGEMRERLVELIKGIIQSRNVRTLFVPAIDDCHGDHRETAKLFVEAARSCPVKYFFSYQIWPPSVRLPQIPMNEIVYTHDISDVLTLKRRAIQKHLTQLGTVDSAHAEGFRMPQALLDAKLQNHEYFALIRDLSAWSA